MTTEPAAPGGVPAAVPVDGPLTPELVRGEVSRAMHDKTHPHHQHFHGWPSDGAEAWLAGLYGRIPGASAPLEIGGQSIDVVGRPKDSTEGVDAAPAAEDIAATADAIDVLRAEWGDHFEANYEDARAEMLRRQQEKGTDALEKELADFLATGGTRAAAIRFLARQRRR